MITACAGNVVLPSHPQRLMPSINILIHQGIPVIDVAAESDPSLIQMRKQFRKVKLVARSYRSNSKIGSTTKGSLSYCSRFLFSLPK